MMRWPWTSRARLDDALQLIGEYKERIAALEADKLSLINEILVRHKVRPILAGPEPAPLVTPAPKAEPEPDNPLDRKIPTLLDEARKGARSGRQIVRNAEAILANRHRERATTKIAMVARDVSQILETPSVPGNNGAQ